jgi:hypothetical protein
VHQLLWCIQNAFEELSKGNSLSRKGLYETSWQVLSHLRVFENTSFATLSEIFIFFKELLKNVKKTLLLGRSVGSALKQHVVCCVTRCRVRAWQWVHNVLRLPLLPPTDCRDVPWPTELYLQVKVQTYHSLSSATICADLQSLCRYTLQSFQ